MTTKTLADYELSGDRIPELLFDENKKYELSVITACNVSERRGGGVIVIVMYENKLYRWIIKKDDVLMKYIHYLSPYFYGSIRYDKRRLNVTMKKGFLQVMKVYEGKEYSLDLPIELLQKNNRGRYTFRKKIANSYYVGTAAESPFVAIELFEFWLKMGMARNYTTHPHNKILFQAADVEGIVDELLQRDVSSDVIDKKLKEQFDIIHRKSLNINQVSNASTESQSKIDALQQEINMLKAEIFELKCR